MSQRTVTISLLSMSLFFILTQYQNCAPQHPGSIASVEADPQVRVIDDWSTQKLVLLESRIELHTSASDVTIDGLCKRSDTSSLTWRLNDQGDQTLENGSSPCEMGGFRMALNKIESLNCGEDYLLEVEHQGGEVGSLWLMRKCAPENSVQIQNLNSEAVCFLETVQDSNLVGTKCEQVCYSSSKVTFKKDLNTNQCPQLQAQAH